MWNICIFANTSGDSLRQAVLKTAEQHVGTKEATGNNDGAVCKYHKSLGYKCGLPWCAIFAKYIYKENDVPTKMDARAVSIKNDPQAKIKHNGGSYWYATGYGSGHTGFIHSWDDKPNSNKFIGLDGNWSNQVSYVVRRKDKHAQYVSNPYNDEDEESLKITKEYTNFVKEEVKKKTVILDVEQFPVIDEPAPVRTKNQNKMELLFYTGLLLLGVVMIIIGKANKDE